MRRGSLGNFWVIYKYFSVFLKSVGLRIRQFIDDSAVGKQVGLVRLGCAEDSDHACQRGVGSGSHVQWFGSQPCRVHVFE